MSARDSSDPAGPGNRGAGGLGNGGVGGGFGGGSTGGGGGAGRNGGANSRTGLGTGATMYGNTAFGRPGGMATGYATRDMASLARAGMGPTMGSYGNFRGLNGQQMFAGSPVQNMNFTGMNANQAFGAAQVQQAAMQAAARNAPRQHVGGLLDGETVLSIEDVPPEVPAYDPLSSVTPPPAPRAWFAGLPIAPDMLQRAVGAGYTPKYNYYDPNSQTMNRYSPSSGFSNSLMSNPQLGTPAPGGSGLGQYSNYSQGSAVGGKTDRGGGGGMRTW